MSWLLPPVPSGTILEGTGQDKLLKALRERLQDESLVLDATLTEFLKVNSIEKPGKLSRSAQEQLTSEALDLIDYKSYLPQTIPLTSTLMTDLLDPVMSVVAPTGVYRLTMRKLLRLTLSQLQRQAAAMEIDPTGLDEVALAVHILVNANQNTELIPELAMMLLAKEMAFVFGIRMQIWIRGPAHPSSTVMLRLLPRDMIQSTLISKDDLLAECENQGVAVNRKENKQQLAIRLVVHWTAHPTQLREPLTARFTTFIVHLLRRSGGL